MKNVSTIGGMRSFNSNIATLLQRIAIFDGHVHFISSRFYKVGHDQNNNTVFLFYDSSYNSCGVIVLDSNNTIIRFDEYRD